MCAEQMSVKLVVKSDSATLSLFAFGSTVTRDLTQVAPDETVTTVASLSAPPIRD